MSVVDKVIDRDGRIGMSVWLLAGMFATFVSGDTRIVAVVFMAVGAACIAETLLSHKQPGEPWIDIGPWGWHAVRWLQVAVVGVGAASIATLHGLGGEYRRSVYMVVAGVIAADIFALLGGKLTRKYLPEGRLSRVLLFHPVKRISGGKTVVGFVSGYVFGATTVVVTGQLFDHGVTPSSWLVLTIPVAAEAGDLLASYTKRVIGTKHYTLYDDNKPLLGQGHGGMMDRFDGHFFAAMIVGTVYWLQLGVSSLL